MGPWTAVREENIVLRHPHRLLPVLMLVVLVVLGAPSVRAQDMARGRELYETLCGDCHYQRVHERDRAKSKVQTLLELRAQVKRWSVQTRRSFSEQDLADIVEYLSVSHYHLEH